MRMHDDSASGRIARLRRIGAEAQRLADEWSTPGQQVHLEPVREFVPTAVRVRRYIRQRRYREALFSAGTFADPAWDILLDLYASELEGRKTTVSDACLASCVPSTTALRWVRKLGEDGVVKRSADSSDGRRIYLTLSEHAKSAISDWVTATLE